MTTDELVLRTLLALLRFQGHVAERMDSKDNEGPSHRYSTRWTDLFERLTRVDHPGGLREETQTEGVCEEVRVPDKRCKGGFRTDQKYVGSKTVVTARYDTLEDLIERRLASYAPLPCSICRNPQCDTPNGKH